MWVSSDEQIALADADWRLMATSTRGSIREERRAL